MIIVIWKVDSIMFAFFEGLGLCYNCIESLLRSTPLFCSGDHVAVADAVHFVYG